MSGVVNIYKLQTTITEEYFFKKLPFLEDMFGQGKKYRHKVTMYKYKASKIKVTEDIEQIDQTSISVLGIYMKADNDVFYQNSATTLVSGDVHRFLNISIPESTQTQWSWIETGVIFRDNDRMVLNNEICEIRIFSVEGNEKFQEMAVSVEVRSATTDSREIVDKMRKCYDKFFAGLELYKPEFGQF